MERLIAYDKLAREDRFVRMRARDTAALKVGKGCRPSGSRQSGVDAGSACTASWSGAASHGGTGGPSTTSPTRRGNSPWTWPPVWDEVGPVEIYLGLLEHLGGYAGEFPESTILWRCACAEDAAARVAGVNRGLEGLACDVFNQLIHIAGKIGDPIIEMAVDYVLADEITHVRMGSKWLNKLTEGDPERRRRAIGFQESIDERFNLGGARQDGAHDEVPISIAREARRLAGFTDEEIERLIKATQRSPVY
jgi:hypothetical protein